MGDLSEKRKPKGAPDWHDSDAPDAEGRFKDLNIEDLADWLIKTRKKDLKRISGAITQQIVFNKKKDPSYVNKMEKVRKEVYKKLGREDLLKESTMKNVMNFQTWLNEEFATIGVPPDGNVIGMGNPTPPSGSGIYGVTPGSGDLWPSLNTSALKKPCTICKRKRCKCKRKNNEK